MIFMIVAGRDYIAVLLCQPHLKEDPILYHFSIANGIMNADDYAMEVGKLIDELQDSTGKRVGP
jgi:hypothetical protein